MENKPTIYDRTIDFLIYAVVFYLLDYHKDWLSEQRILHSLFIALIATVIRALLDPYIDSWRAKRRSRKAEEKKSETPN